MRTKLQNLTQLERTLVCGALVCLLGGSLHGASSDHSGIIRPVFSKPRLDNVTLDKSGLATAMMEKFRRESPVFERLVIRQFVRANVRAYHASVEEVYQHPHTPELEPFHGERAKGFRRVAANGSTDVGYRVGRHQNHGHDIDN